MEEEKDGEKEQMFDIVKVCCRQSLFRRILCGFLDIDSRNCR